MRQNIKGFKRAKVFVIFLVLGVIGLVSWYAFTSSSGGIRTKYENQGPAMEPTFKDGQVIYGVIKPVSEVKRGDIIIFDPPITTVERAVKRVIGLPGDTLVIESGKITVTTSDGSSYDPGLRGEPKSQ